MSIRAAARAPRRRRPRPARVPRSRSTSARSARAVPRRTRARAVCACSECRCRRAVPGRRRVELEEHVRGLVPRATRDRASVGNCVPQPFAHVARHVVSAVRSDPGVSTDRRGAFAREVARADDRRSKRFEPLIQRHGGPVPVVRGWQLLAAKSRVGDGLEPAHAGDRVVAGAVGIRACLPGRRSRASGRIDECRDCGQPVRRLPLRTADRAKARPVRNHRASMNSLNSRFVTSKRSI